MRLAVGLLAGALLLSACNDDPVRRATATPSPAASPVPSPTPSRTPRPTQAARPSPKPSPKAVVRHTVAARKSPAPRRTSASVALCPRVPSVDARQVVLVVGSGSSATVRACERRDGQWVSVMGRMYGHVGLNGVAPPGAKREGDKRTPSGTFALGRGFGVRGNPGVAFAWHRTTSADVWVDDSGSDLYNTWQQKPANGRWDSAEDLYVPGNYDYVQVIGYNTARVPGKGSAIFLHVDHQSGTFGCVTLPRSPLLRVLRWERPGAVMVIR